LSRSNEFVMTGQLSERDALRHTPAGIALVNFRITHESEQLEAGSERQVYADVACVAVEDEARLIAAAPLGTAVRLTGFLAGRGSAGAPRGAAAEVGPKAGSRSGRQLVLHVTRIEFEERELNLRPVDPVPAQSTGARRGGDGT